MKLNKLIAATITVVALNLIAGSGTVLAAVWYNITTPDTTVVGHLHLDDSSCGGTLAGCSFIFGSGIPGSPDYDFAFNAGGLSLDSDDLLAANATFQDVFTHIAVIVNGFLTFDPPGNEIETLPELGISKIAEIDILYVPTEVVPSAVPIPAALPLLGSALAVIGGIGWRRRKKTLEQA